MLFAEVGLTTLSVNVGTSEHSPERGTVRIKTDGIVQEVLKPTQNV